MYDLWIEIFQDPVLKDQGNIFFQEENEDMWHVYNLVAIGDKLRASTFRKVVTETSTGNL